MSRNKKIRSRLNKLFDEIKQTEETGPLPEKRESLPAPVLPTERPKQPLHTPRSLSPDTLPARPPVTTTAPGAAGPSTLAIPFQAGNAWNLIQLEQDEKYEWQEEEQSLVRQVADQLGLALQNAQLYQETQKRASELATLNEIVRAVSAQIGLKQVLEAAYQQIRKLVPVDVFIVALYDEKTNMLSFPVVIDEGKYYDEVPTPINPANYTGKTIISGKLLQAYLTPEEAAAAAAQKDGAIGNTQKLSGSLLFIPLKVGPKTIGCMSVQNYSFIPYTAEDVTLLENITNQISVGIQNARLFEETQIKEANFRNLIENAPEAILVMDTETGLFADPNENAATLFKLSREELVKCGHAQLSAEIQLDGRPTSEVANEKISAALQGETQIFEWLYKDSEGTIIPCEIHMARLPGERPLLRATVIDITERKRIEEKLAEERILMRTLIDNLPDNVFVKDVDSRIVMDNIAHRRLLGATMLEQVVGKTDFDFFSKELASSYYADEKQVIQSGESLINREEPVVDKDGNQRWLMTTKVLLRDHQGMITGIVGINHDITERKLAELNLDRRAKQLQATSEIVSATAAIPTEKRLLETFVQLTQQRFGLYHAHIFLLEDDERTLSVRACGWQEDSKLEGTHETATFTIDQEVSLVARAARTRKSVMVNDVHSDPTWLPNPSLPDVRSEMAIPVIAAGNRLIGVLNVHSEQANAFTDADAAIYTTLAAQIGTSVQNVRQFAQAQARARREQLLREITSRVRGSTDPDVIMRTAVREIGQAMGMQSFIRIGTADELANAPAQTTPTSPAPAAAEKPKSIKSSKASRQPKKAEGEN